MGINKVRTYRLDGTQYGKIACKVALIQARARKEFAPEKYGYAAVLKRCDRITVLNAPKGDRQEFFMVGLQRRINENGVNGDNYDCVVASAILREWLKNEGIKAKVLYGIANSFMAHSVVYIPDFGFFGATPIDRDIRYVELDDIKTLSFGRQPWPAKLNDKMSLDDLKPMQWVELGGHRAAIVFAGMCYDPMREEPKEKKKDTPPFMDIKLSIYILKHMKIVSSYLYKLSFLRQKLWLLKKVARQTGPKGILEAYMNRKFFIANEYGQTDDPLMRKLIAQHEGIVWTMIHKIDPMIADLFRIYPEY